jgi:hypothetical protein
MMNATKTLTLTAVAALFGISAAQAAVSPLQPAYFWDKANVQVTANTGAEIRKATNPLEPTYFQGNVSQSFVGTATGQPIAISNPLHPQFQRN